MNNNKKIRPYFKFKNASIYQGNVLNSNIFPKDFCDLIITSPPYNVGIEYNSNDDILSYDDYLEFTRKWIANCYQWSKDSGRFLLNIPLDKNKGGQKSVGADITTIAQQAGWKYHSTIIWNEGNISRRTAWGSFMSASAPYVIAPVELILVLYKKEWKKITGSKISDITKKDFMEWTNGVWTFNGESKKRIGHPAPFPKELPYRAIKLFSYVNDIVFDPFSGSGTTAIVSALNNRIGIGLDIDLGYCELSKKRVLQELNILDFFGVKNEKIITDGINKKILSEKSKKRYKTSRSCR
jgi:site-specific DNA-methyltransferase (adenine-specific)